MNMPVKPSDNTGAVITQAPSNGTELGVETAREQAGAPRREPQAMEIGGAEQKTVGLVGDAEPKPVRTVVGSYHKGEKSAEEYMRLLNRGFEADKAGNYEKALADYHQAFELLADAIKEDMARRIAADEGSGVARQFRGDFSYERSHERLGAWVVQHPGVAPELRDALKIYYNRTGLALKHEADATQSRAKYDEAIDSVRVAVALDPAYGPAHYNLACASLKLGDEGAALASLRTAIRDVRFDFKKLAREQDTDWNGIRLTNAEFRALVDLPALRD